MICVLISDNIKYLLGLCYIWGTVPCKCFCELIHFTHISMNSVLTIQILWTHSNLTAVTELLSGKVLDLYPNLSDCPALLPCHFVSHKWNRAWKANTCLAFHIYLFILMLNQIAIVSLEYPIKLGFFRVLSTAHSFLLLTHYPWVMAASFGFNYQLYVKILKPRSTFLLSLKVTYSNI